jgi:dCMP deaminase
MLNDIYYLKIAYQVAKDEATDPSTQNGAILVNDQGTILCSGANHFPRDVKETPDRWKRPLKYSFVEHSERNCLFTAAREGIKTQGTIMYCCWAACTDCMRAIIQTGIRKLVVHHDPHDIVRFGMPVSEQWRESISIALEMLKESKIELVICSEKLFDSDFTIRYNGKEVSP